VKDFQGKVTIVVKAIGLALDDFDLVVDAFELAGMDRMVTVIQDAVAIVLQAPGKLDDVRVADGARQGTPLGEAALRPPAVTIGPYLFGLSYELVDDATAKCGVKA
jgi:hypothetical protein